MSMLKSLQSLSKMEFYKNALDIRKEVTGWMMRDFGIKRTGKEVQAVLQDMSMEDILAVNDIYEKYGYSLKKVFSVEHSRWYLDSEKHMLNRICQELTHNITMANSIYVQKDNLAEYELRRSYQDKAIGNCFSLYAEISSIRATLPTSNLKFLDILFEKIAKEIDLLKGWRQSDNKNKPDTTKDKKNKKEAKE